MGGRRRRDVGMKVVGRRRGAQHVFSKPGVMPKPPPGFGLAGSGGCGGCGGGAHWAHWFGGMFFWGQRNMADPNMYCRYDFTKILCRYEFISELLICEIEEIE